MKLIVGLGNPGANYSTTRHNLGFMIIDNFAKFLNVKIEKEKFNGNYADVIINGEKVILLKPLSYMNLSGTVVKKYVDYFNFNIEDILVICDDINLDFLKCRLRSFGSSGGHNGLKNIELCLGTDKFKRMRVGISRDNKVDIVNYVLGSFSKDNLDSISKFLPFTSQVLLDYVSFDFESLMNKYN